MQLDVSRIPTVLELAAEGGSVGASAVKELRLLVIEAGAPTPLAEPVMPFLLDLVSADNAPQRAALLVLAADLAAGGAHFDFLFGADPVPNPLRDALGAIRPVLCDLVALSDPKVRASALLAGAMVVRPGTALAASIREAASMDPGSLAQGMALLALGRMARAAEGPASSWEQDAALCEKGLRQKGAQKTLAALAYVAAGVEPPASALAQLRAAMVDRARRVNGLALNDGDLRGAAAWTLLAPNVVAQDLERVQALLALAGQHGLATDVGAMVVSLAFPSGAQAEPAEPKTPKDLTPFQRDLLLTLNGMPKRAFASPTGLNRALKSRGLPFKGPRLERLVGARASGPADAIVEGLPLWKWCWLALHTPLPAERLRGLLAQRPAEDAMDAVLDLAADPYGLYDSTDPAAETALCALLTECALECAEPEALSQRADALLAQLEEGRRHDRAAVLLCAAQRRAGGELEPRFDALLASAMRAEALAPTLRKLLSGFPPERVEALVLGLPADTKPKGPKYVWLFAGLVPTEAVAQRLVNEVLGWGERSETPAEHAVMVLRSLGAVAHPALDHALGTHPGHAQVGTLRRARTPGA